jgi:hypothetical protein
MVQMLAATGHRRRRSRRTSAAARRCAAAAPAPLRTAAISSRTSGRCRNFWTRRPPTRPTQTAPRPAGGPRLDLAHLYHHHTATIQSTKVWPPSTAPRPAAATRAGGCLSRLCRRRLKGSPPLSRSLAPETRTPLATAAALRRPPAAARGGHGRACRTSAPGAGAFPIESAGF